MKEFKKTLGCFLVAVMSSVLPVQGGSITARWDTAREQIELTSDGPYVRVRLEGASVTNLPAGSPALPSRAVYVLVPPGASNLSLQLTAVETKLAEAVAVYPVQPERSTDEPNAPFVKLDAAFLGHDGIMPQDIGHWVGTARMGGYHVAIIQLNPVRYNPGRMELYLATSITGTLSYEEATVPADVLIASSRTVGESILDLVANPEDLERFYNSDVTQQEPQPASEAPPILPAADNSAIYLLITNNALSSAFQPLVNRRTAQGKIGRLVTVETIQSTFPGVDVQDKIRNCIRQHLQDHGTSWVALGGSDVVVPPRYVEGNIPVDLYYGCLDGDWNADGDAVYGEAIVDNVDLYPEVWVGRIPVQTASQATDYVNKLVRFEDASVSGYSGTMLIASNQTWFMSGLARPAGYDDHDPVSETEAPMRNLYRNVIQPYWQASPLDLLFTTYTTWDTARCGDYGVTWDNMAARLNWGYHYFYLWGYGNGSGGTGIDAAMGSALSNANRPSVLYVTASSSSAYDQQEPCISEAFLRNPNGGAIAYVGATRNAASTDYHASLFFKEVFQNRRATIGEAFGIAMMNEAPYRLYKDSWRSWYLALCLQGDPALSFKGLESGRRLQIISPHGCEVLADSGDLTIRWNASGTDFAADERVKLQYSSDSGTTWLPVSGAEARLFNSRAFVWEGHSLPAGSGYRVRVVSLANPAVSDASDRDFTIGPVYLLTVRSTPEVNLQIGGTHPNYTNYTYSVLVGSPISLTAPSRSGYSFVRWADANGNTITSNTVLNVVCQGNRTVTAEYAAVSKYRHYYVNDDIAEDGFAAGDNDNDGLTPLRPLRNIQQVFIRYADVAAIHVSAGTFVENLSITRSYPSLLIEGASPDLTIIDGGQVGRCLTLSGTGSCTIQKLTLRNGQADNGGGIRVSGYSLTARRCKLTANSATASGGAIYASSVTVDVDACLIAGNLSSIGGGIDVSQSQLSVANSLMHGNSATGSGGAVSARSSSQLILRGSTIADNTAGQTGGGLFIADSGVGAMTNSLLWQNHAAGGLQAQITTGANLTAAYCNVQGGAAQIGKDASSILTWLQGNMSNDPLFLNPGGPDNNAATWFDNDFHISMRSPCRQAGDPDFVSAFLETDIDGQLRLQAGRVDIGADETSAFGDLDHDGDVDDSDRNALEACATGPGIPYVLASLMPSCELAADVQGCLLGDSECDRDIDQVDFALLQAATTGPLVPADLDRDFDVDRTDLAILQVCWTGSQIPQTDPFCFAADLDGDGDVDQGDFGMAQRCLSGDGVAPDPHCSQ